MRKGLIVFGALLLLLAFGWVICNVTGIFKMYTTPTTGNEPGLKQGSRFFASSLKDPEAGDLIVYRKDSMLYTHRLIGMAGDIVEIKKGTVLINGKDFDRSLKLKHGYILNEADARALASEGLADPDDVRPVPGGQYLVLLEDHIAKAKVPSSIRWLMNENEAEKMIKEQYGKDWNKDHLGPYTIPDGKLFVLGDNRDNSIDSRYFGCINASDVKGTVLK